MTAAAIMNPGLSSWLALTVRAALTPGESVLVFGATGVAGRLAIQAARLLGAGRVTVAGRDRQALASLAELGADAAVELDSVELTREHYDMILDYLWGPPAEALLASLAQQGSGSAASRVRYVQIGASAGPTITLAGEILRGSGLELLGSGAGSVPMPKILQAIPEYLQRVAAGGLHIDTETIPLAEVQWAWNRAQRGRRLVVMPEDPQAI